MTGAVPSRAMADAIVIGGGFYGCETALELRRLGFSRVIVAERENDILRRASYSIRRASTTAITIRAQGRPHCGPAAISIASSPSTLTR
jgi:NADPH-dependent 2,4-dienoyl-CoA reductase/sulfur reductase-like enzyme